MKVVDSHAGNYVCRNISPRKKLSTYISQQARNYYSRGTKSITVTRKRNKPQITGIKTVKGLVDPGEWKLNGYAVETRTT